MADTLDDWVQPIVDPEVRAYISSLVTAVGGCSPEHDGRYVLGDEALATLKDIRRWLALYDQRMNRYDVARCLAEQNFVQGDLLEILAQWPEEQTDSVLKHRFALSCLELLVPLTWPYDVKPDEMTVNHHRHLPYLRLSQARYKRSIIQYEHAKVLRTAVRVGLPSMAVPRRERNPRDEAIIRIVLYFLRNIAWITQPPRSPSEGDSCEISRSATIEAFREQDIFQVLLTISSSMGDEFILQDVVILEILYHLLKGINPEVLFMHDEKVSKKDTQEFKNILKKEKAMLASQSKYAPTRHNRFGTMIWVKRGDEKVSTVSGQDVLGNAQQSLQKMDKTKKWDKPKFRGRVTEEHTERDSFDKPVHISANARKYLKNFTEEFLDSSFNPLFLHLRKAIQSGAERVLEEHTTQFFYVISWFLKAECARRKEQQTSQAKQPDLLHDEGFDLVAGVINHETFALLNVKMQHAQDERKWQELNAMMKSFTEMLLTVQDMAESKSEEDQEIAENIQNNIFYEATTHDRVLSLLRTYKEQGLGYLDACTELAHVFIRMLERYSKQNVDLQIRSIRKARKKRKEETADGVDETGNEDLEAEDVAEAQRTVTERKFDFTRFSARFMTENCVNTFVSLTRYYSDLNSEQLKRAHRFFYRLAFKNELAILLCRADILSLFHKMIKGPDSLDPELAAFKEWEELVKQIFRRAVKKIQERPELIVEMLFSKIPATLFYLEHGYEEERVTRPPRPPAELEVKPGMTKEERVGVAVGLLINNTMIEQLKWVKSMLLTAANERKSWEDLEVARKETAGAMAAATDELASQSVEHAQAPSIPVRPDNDERRVELFKNNKLRLLLKVLGFQRIGLREEVDASWVISSSMTSAELIEAAELLDKFEFAPPTYEDDKGPENFITTEAAAEHIPRRRRAAFDDDSPGPDDQDPDEFLFPEGGPTVRRSEALEKLKDRRKRKRTSVDEVDEEELQRRAERRRQTELEKRRKIKSEMYVRDSDDETDEEADKEFFAKEERRRKDATSKIRQALLTGKSLEEIEGASKKRKSQKENNSRRQKHRRSASRDAEDSADISPNDSSREGSEEPEALNVGLSDDDDHDVDTPLSSLPHVNANSEDESADERNTNRSKPSLDKDVVMRGASDEEDEELVVSRQPLRRNVRVGFIIDSDSE